MWMPLCIISELLETVSQTCFYLAKVMSDTLIIHARGQTLPFISVSLHIFLMLPHLLLWDFFVCVCFVCLFVFGQS